MPLSFSTVVCGRISGCPESDKSRLSRFDCDKAMHCFLSHLSRHFRHDVVKEPERGHVEQLVTELRPADDSLQHLPRHRDLRRTE